MKNNLLRGVSVLSIVIILILSAATITAYNKAPNANTSPSINDVTITAGDKKSNSNANSLENLIFHNKKPLTTDSTIIFQDDFESYVDFVLDFPPWIQNDVDGAQTYGMVNYNYTNENYVGSFIIFNPSQTIPPVPDAPPHSGAKFAACFNAVLPADNNDWLITPQLTSAKFDNVSFWARSYTDAYNLDRFAVGISTTDTNSSSFTIVSPGSYIEAPIEWTQYTYDLSGYSGNIYIAIHCVSHDSFILMVDDFTVSEKEFVAEPAVCCDGNLIWKNVKGGSTVNGTFQVCNCGDNGSLLNWEVSSFPTWGNWTFTPSSGTGLAAGDCITIYVEVKAPAQKKKTFTGKIVMDNLDNETDVCEIDVSLTTPRTADGLTLMQLILQRHPNMFPILRNILA